MAGLALQILCCAGFFYEAPRTYVASRCLEAGVRRQMLRRRGTRRPSLQRDVLVEGLGGWQG